MKMLGRSWGAAVACFLVGLVWAVGMAKADEMALAPDGKIVVVGKTFPEFGALARLDPAGTVDGSFGSGGYMIDPRLPSFVSVALQTDDRVLAGAMGGFQLARYTSEGAVDPAFGQDGIGGTEDPEQPHFLYPGFGPTSLSVRPDQSILVGGNRSALSAGDAEALVRDYTAAGELRETIGRVPPLGGAADASYLHDLFEEEGALYGVGSTYQLGEGRTRPFLARFLRGSGTDFDPNFADGAGLARVDLPTSSRFTSAFDAIEGQGEKLLAAGRSGGTVLLARFDREGNVDSGFGEDGYTAPPIAGPAVGPGGQPVPDASSWANDVAVTPDGHILVAGGTTQWGHWIFSKSSGFICGECPQPILLRFTADGKLDQGFGDGGLLRLRQPDGSTFEGDVDQVEALADGKLLIEGSVPTPGVGSAPFVARLKSDGSYDSSFGSGGLTVLDLPCTDESESRKRQLGCVPRLRPQLRLFGMRRGRPALVLRARPSEAWGGIYEVTLTLPRGMRLKKGFRSKLRAVPVGSTEAGKMEVSVIRASKKRRRETLLLQRLGIAGEVKVRLPRGSLRVNRHLRKLRPHRKVGFRVSAQFTHLGWGGYYGYDDVVRRVG